MSSIGYSPIQTKHGTRRLSELVNPLSLLNISLFFHLRVYRDHTFFIICHHQKIAQYHQQHRQISTQHVELAQTSTPLRLSTCYWPDPPTDHTLEFIQAQGFWHGLSVGLPFEAFIDIFSFAGLPDKIHLKHLYLNHLNLIKRYIIFYRLHAAHLIDQATRHRSTLDQPIQLYSQYDDKRRAQTSAIQTVIASLQPKRISIPAANGSHVQLTERQTFFLLQLLEGKSMRHIAQEWDLSPRTIECYLERMKTKAGYYSKFALINAFLSAYTYQPSLYCHD